ncbi:trans-resveratrol di-O-methyltransferase-like [Gossypium australe]|uniref:Trans-resveratrol di-O-methyltransferase-like n=1 Tax=Gossypium australe TaxID=47621 RepID=A0A5B6WPR2_9ROSI|nr:trans-resveratrol di-O-methyltransferase-like [Gossypium australe]
MLGNLSINPISEEGIGEENLSCICPTYLEVSPNINDMSDATTDSGFPFKQDIWPEEPRDFEDNRDCNLSSDLLRMKQILPYKELVEIVSLKEEKEEKIGAYITAETKWDLIKLLQEFKDVFTWSYQDMLGLSTNIVVHRLSIKEEYKPVQ